MKAQEKKLLNSLVLVVENLRNPEVLEPVLNALGARHVGYGEILWPSAASTPDDI
jgi:hemoglobin-like flavoprotein